MSDWLVSWVDPRAEDESRVGFVDGARLAPRRLALSCFAARPRILQFGGRAVRAPPRTAPVKRELSDSQDGGRECR